MGHDGRLNKYRVSTPIRLQVKPDRLWHDKYTLRRAMIPAFLSYEQANKILLSGKSINFLRQLCQDQAITDGAISGAIPGCPPRPAIAADINGIPGYECTSLMTDESSLRRDH